MKLSLPALAFAVTSLVAAALPPAGGAASTMAAVGTATIPTLTVGFASSVPTLNIDNANAGFGIIQLCLETVLKFNSSGQLVPELATSVSQPGPTTYVYRLRQGVQFWDGSEMTSADVVYSWNYERQPSAYDYDVFADVKSVTAAGPWTVVVRLVHPNPSWQYTPALSGSEIFEKKFAEAHPGTFGQPGVLVMGTGPWKVDSLDPTTGAELSANPNWWGGSVPIAHISVKFFSSETSMALAMRAGAIDLVTYIPDPDSFAATSGATIVSAPSFYANALFSMNTQTPPWNDVHVRRAAAYALDRPAIIAASGGPANPLYTLLIPQMLKEVASPGQINALMSSLPLYRYNLAKAKQELEESAYPHGFHASLFQYSGYPDVNISQVVAAQLAKIGIDTQVKLVPIGAWSAAETGPPGRRPTAEFTYGAETPDISGYDWLLGRQNLKVGQEDTAAWPRPR